MTGGMDFTRDILLLTNDLETQRAVLSALEPDQHIAQVHVCKDIVSLINQLERSATPVALVDIDPQSVRMLEELAPIIDRFAQRRFAVLSSNITNDLVMKAMQAGARHVQMKETIKSELAGALRRLIPENSPLAHQVGNTFTILSASGGCGCTTLSVNLANELQIEEHKPVLLVDLDYHYGAVATYLELHGQFGVADVLAHDGCIDPQLINSTTVRHAKNLDVLLSPVSVDFSSVDTLRYENLNMMLAACKQSHTYTVIDAPRISMDIAATLAAASELTLIVLQPTVKDLRLTKAMLAALTDRGIAGDCIMPIVNRYRKRGQMISFEDAQGVLDGVNLGRLRNDYTSAIRGINYGKPLAHAAPRSLLRRDLVDLAHHMSGLNAENNGNGRGTEL